MLSNVRELLDPAAQLLVSQHVVRLQLLARHAVEVEDLDDGAREPTLRLLGGTFHEQHYGVSLDCTRDFRAGFCRE